MVRLEVPPRFAGRGYQDLADAVLRTSASVAQRLNEFGREMGPQWETLAKAMVERVVYAAYTPIKYQRNRNLLKAIIHEVNPIQSVGVEVVIRNDTASVQPTHPKGGSPNWRVPWEIEEGEYPQPWFGYTASRPYMAATAAHIAQILPEAVGPFITRGLAEFAK